MKAVSYLRVSTVEQAKHGYSLDSQDKSNRDFAIAHGYDIVRVFREEGESAKSTDRTELQKLLPFASDRKNKIQAVIVWKFDRLARNLFDQLRLMRDLALCGISVLSVNETNEDTPEGRLSRNMFGAFAQFENEDRARKTVINMKAAVKTGRWLWRPPIGYKREIGPTGKTILVPSNKAPLIEKAFEMALSGQYRKSEISEYLKLHGLPEASDKLTHRILSNPLYCSIIRVPWFPDDIQACHEPIIPLECFEKVQIVLAGGNPAATRKTNHPEFPLRRFVRCEQCNTPMTGGFCRGRHGGKYPYYFCRTRGCSLTISKAQLEDRFMNYLNEIRPNMAAVKWLMIAIRRYWKQEQAQASVVKARISRELHDLEKKKAKADELMMREVFDEDTYRERTLALRSAITVKRIELHEAQTDGLDIETVLAWCERFIKDSALLWSRAELEGKQAVQNAIFPQGISFTKNEGFRTHAISLLFSQLTDDGTKKKTVGVPNVIDFKPYIEAARAIYRIRNTVAA